MLHFGLESLTAGQSTRTRASPRARAAEPDGAVDVPAARAGWFLLRASSSESCLSTSVFQMTGPKAEMNFFFVLSCSN